MISIITPALKSETTISNLLNDLENQTSNNFEWIIADGGSSDRTLEILYKSRLINKYIDSTPDKGIFDGMNRALKISNGTHYLVIGSDDRVFPGTVEKINKILEKEDIDLAIFPTFFGNKLRNGFWRPERGWLGAYHVATSHSVGMLIKKDIHNITGVYSHRFPLCADLHFIKKLTKNKSLKVKIENESIGIFNINGASNKNSARMICEGFLIQLETEKSPHLQIFIFILRLIKNYFKITTQCIASKTH